MNYPNVIGEFETVAELIKGKSIARVGDGELKLMYGQSYFREPPSIYLARELLDLVRSPHENCLVGIPTMAPNGPKYKNWLRHAGRFAKVLDHRATYHSAFITRPDSAPWINTIEVAKKLEEVWRDRRVAVLSEPGNKILKAVGLSAKKVKRIHCPSDNAYNEIDRLEAEIIARKPDVAILSCGPTATCLANRLAIEGIQAIDIGSAGGYLLRLLYSSGIPGKTDFPGNPGKTEVGQC